MKRTQSSDDNQPDIVKRYRAHGAEVDVVSKWRPYDLVVSVAGQTSLVEIKNPEQPPSKRKLSDNERDFHEKWKAPIPIILTIDDVDAHVAAMRKRALQ